MITKDQLLEMNGSGELHYTGNHKCTKTVGPRGGVTLRTMKVRLSGQCKIWKRGPARFRQPVKYGMYVSSWIDETNYQLFHLSSDCPALKEE
jgi:hypothetical protein